MGRHSGRRRRDQHIDHCRSSIHPTPGGRVRERTSQRHDRSVPLAHPEDRPQDAIFRAAHGPQLAAPGADSYLQKWLHDTAMAPQSYLQRSPPPVRSPNRACSPWRPHNLPIESPIHVDYGKSARPVTTKRRKPASSRSSSIIQPRHHHTTTATPHAHTHIRPPPPHQTLPPSPKRGRPVACHDGARSNSESENEGDGEEKLSRKCGPDSPYSAGMYEKRRRHKTKEDRYEPKRKRKKTHHDHDNDADGIEVAPRKGKERGQDGKSGKKKNKKALASGKEVVVNFASDAIHQERLTMRPGLFTNGKASGAVPHLSDLAFNEMDFLKKASASREAPKVPARSRDKEKEKRKDEREMEKISDYFRSGKAARGSKGKGVDGGAGTAATTTAIASSNRYQGAEEVDNVTGAAGSRRGEGGEEMTKGQTKESDPRTVEAGGVEAGGVEAGGDNVVPCRQDEGTTASRPDTRRDNATSSRPGTRGDGPTVASPSKAASSKGSRVTTYFTWSPTVTNSNAIRAVPLAPALGPSVHGQSTTDAASGCGPGVDSDALRRQLEATGILNWMGPRSQLTSVSSLRGARAEEVGWGGWEERLERIEAEARQRGGRLDSSEGSGDEGHCDGPTLGELFCARNMEGGVRDGHGDRGYVDAGYEEDMGFPPGVGGGEYGVRQEERGADYLEGYGRGIEGGSREYDGYDLGLRPTKDEGYHTGLPGQDYARVPGHDHTRLTRQDQIRPPGRDHTRLPGQDRLGEFSCQAGENGPHATMMAAALERMRSTLPGERLLEAESWLPNPTIIMPTVAHLAGEVDARQGTPRPKRGTLTDQAGLALERGSGRRDRESIFQFIQRTEGEVFGRERNGLGDDEEGDEHEYCGAGVGGEQRGIGYGYDNGDRDPDERGLEWRGGGGRVGGRVSRVSAYGYALEGEEGRRLRGGHDGRVEGRGGGVGVEQRREDEEGVMYRDRDGDGDRETRLLMKGFWRPNRFAWF